MMKDNTTIAAIAIAVGLKTDYCRKQTGRLAASENIDYKPIPNAAPAVLTVVSSKFRNNMANLIYDLRNARGAHQLAIARETGLTQSQQILASENGGKHDYSLSQLERISVASAREFNKMMIIAMFDGYSDEDKALTKRMLACMNS